MQSQHSIDFLSDIFPNDTSTHAPLEHFHLNVFNQSIFFRGAVEVFHVSTKY
jgi:hypothetical protein